MQKYVLRRSNAVAGPEEIRLREHERGRQPARADEFLRPVAVGQDAIDQRRPLDEGGRQHLPFVRRDHERNQIDLPGPVQPAGVAVNVVGDPLLVDEATDRIGAALEFGRAELVEVAHQRTVAGAHLAGVGEELVEGGARRLVTGQQRRRFVRRRDGRIHVAPVRSKTFSSWRAPTSASRGPGAPFPCPKVEPRPTLRLRPHSPETRLWTAGTGHRFSFTLGRARASVSSRTSGASKT